MAQLYAAAAAAGVPVTAVASAKASSEPAPVSQASPPQPNPVADLLSASKPRALLERHLALRDESFDKLRDEIEKTDEAAVSESARSFAGLNLAATLCALPMPVLLLHGKGDSFLPPPDEELLSKITASKTRGAFFALIALDFRHFPMLENTAAFSRLITDFLDADLTNTQITVQLKETWRRQIR